MQGAQDGVLSVGQGALLLRAAASAGEGEAPTHIVKQRREHAGVVEPPSIASASSTSAPAPGRSPDAWSTDAVWRSA